jgi:hypothetical protein
MAEPTHRSEPNKDEGNMTTKWITTLTALSAAALLAGCGEGTDTTTTDTNAAASATGVLPRVSETAAANLSESAKAAGAEVAKVADSAKAELKTAASAVGEALSDAGGVAQEKLDDLTAQVKQLIKDGKGSEAAQKLQSAMANLKLTPEQKQKLEELVKQAQSALAKGVETASSAAENLLKAKATATPKTE